MNGSFNVIVTDFVTIEIEEELLKCCSQDLFIILIRNENSKGGHSAV